MPLSVRSSTEGTDPKCARRDAPSVAILSAPIQGALARATAIPSAGGAELPAGKPLRDTAGRPQGRFPPNAVATRMVKLIDELFGIDAVAREEKLDHAARHVLEDDTALASLHKMKARIEVICEFEDLKKLIEMLKSLERH
jgi:hypothetical protein